MKPFRIAVLLSLVPLQIAIPLQAQVVHPLPPLQTPPGLTQGNPETMPDVHDCTLVAQAQPILDIAPLKQDATARLQFSVARDGRAYNVHVIDGAGSGDAARDAAMVANVEQNWRWRPRPDQSCSAVTLRVVVHFPHVTCAPLPLPESQTAPDDVDIQDRPRSVALAVGVAPDGAVTTTSVSRSSGDAALDAAAMAHVKAAWRWQPYVCNGQDGKPLAQVMGAATVNFPYAVPDTPARR